MAAARAGPRTPRRPTLGGGSEPYAAPEDPPPVLLKPALISQERSWGALGVREATLIMHRQGPSLPVTKRRVAMLELYPGQACQLQHRRQQRCQLGPPLGLRFDGGSCWQRWQILLHATDQPSPVG